MIILAADFGGTTLKLGVVSQGAILAQDRLPAHSQLPMDRCLAEVAARWELMLTSLQLTLARCTAASLALPFLSVPNQARVQGDFGKFPGAVGIDFQSWAATRLGLPLALENDLRVALLGEWSSGAARGHHDVVMIALGTGIGCAAICGDRLFRGAHHRAATLLGHSTVSLNSPPGRCGNPGCAEDLASTATLGEIARARPDYTTSPLRHASHLNYELVFQHADQGDACSRALIDNSLHVWATVALNAALAFDPAVIVLGGGILRRPEVVLPAVRAHLNRHLAAFNWTLPVVAASLGDAAALIGCEPLVLDQLATHG